jgi:hypothetical protein
MNKRFATDVRHFDETIATFQGPNVLNKVLFLISLYKGH